MRTILFFDLPQVTLSEKRAYRHFVKELIKNGFYRIQESVFVRMNINQTAVDIVLNYIDSIKPKSGNIMAITVTEKQFARMKIMLGSIESDVESSDSRLVRL